MAETVNDLGNGITMKFVTACGQKQKIYSINGEAAVARMAHGGIYIHSNRWKPRDIPQLAAALLMAMDSGFPDTNRNIEQTHMEGDKRARAIKEGESVDYDW